MAPKYNDELTQKKRKQGLNRQRNNPTQVKQMEIKKGGKRSKTNRK